MAEITPTPEPEVPSEPPQPSAPETADAYAATPAKPRTCPRCGVTDIRPSRVRGIFDVVNSWFGRAPFRCRSCWGRFHTYAPEILREQEEMRRSGRLPSR